MNDSTFKVIYVGSIRQVNNLGTLVDAARYLKDDKSIQILIYGDGTEKKKLEEECNANNLNVKFKGRVEKKYIPFILSHSDLNVINVRAAALNKYGCSWNKLFEYMASSKPILCNLPVKYDLIKKYHLGITRRFADGEAYKNAILKFVNMDKKEYEQYCRNSRECGKMFDYKNLATKIEIILQKVVESK